MPITDRDWVKSSYSGANGGECVEWAPRYAGASGVVPVRDSKCVGGPVLMVTSQAWVGLVTLVRAG
ncbi:DUF397 domain-containing protein [Streptomyces sp. LE64]|uniref:DUF397 domain-containing protein n=1 Tax=Streptomyces sp. LE64 TaxID=3448653 RepID=UPI0040422A8B